jgi:hypothetical protein
MLYSTTIRVWAAASAPDKAAVAPPPGVGVFAAKALRKVLTDSKDNDSDAVSDSDGGMAFSCGLCKFRPMLQ